MRSAIRPADRVRMAQSIMLLRRRREALFGADLFADPSWDILLQLYIAEASGRGLLMKGLGIGAGIPSTTVLRWTAQLEARGMIYRETDDQDRRRIWMRLSDTASDDVDALIDHFADSCATLLGSLVDARG